MIRPQKSDLSEKSRAEIVALLSPEERSVFYASLSEDEAKLLMYDWMNFWARPKQKLPDSLGKQHYVWLLLAGRGWGKALALDTPLPTPTGWTTMGEVQVGDLLLDELARPCRVKAVTDVQYQRICYRMIFSNGEHVVADADHQWLTTDGIGNEAVVTTGQILDTLSTQHWIACPSGLVAITAVEPVESVPVKCIEVDSPSHLFLCSRSFIPTHNSRVGAEAIKYLVEERGYRRVAMVARTSADARDVMIEGPSGLLSCYPDGERPLYEPAKRRITFRNGAIGITYSADKPEQLRGPQHDLAWCDELAAWRYPEAWDQLQFGMRLGETPLTIVTTTPRPTKLVKELVNDSVVYVTRGSTYENASNLAAPALRQLINKYHGTRLGLQELDAQILDDTPGALWTRANIDQNRIRNEMELPPMMRVIVALDPSVTSGEESAETGIIVVGQDRFGHIYVLDDGSMQGRPSEWARKAIQLYHQYDADRIVAEINNGGEMIETVIRTEDRSINFKQVRATKGKYTRAEPVSALYEQGRVSHAGYLAELEDQMCTWVPGEKSPDRLDALVWGITELSLKTSGRPASTRTRVEGLYSSQNRSENRW